VQDFDPMVGGKLRRRWNLTRPRTAHGEIEQGAGVSSHVHPTWCAAVAAWRDRVAAGIIQLTRQAEQQALDELATLEETLAQTASKAPELKEAIIELDQIHNRLPSE